ncbi:MAG: aminopeptidase P family protein [Candidatus Carbobacillus altaicus]|nr:aminopeptidase P family protein [Candidatus Carbobacillus altaicus]
MHREKIISLLKEEGIEALFVTSPANRRYLTGFTGSSGMVLLTETETYLFTDFRYTEQAMQEAPEVEVVESSHSPWDTIAEKLKHLGISRVGFEREHVTVEMYDALPKGDGLQWIGTTHLVGRKLRPYKSPEEIAKIKRACALADEAFMHILSLIAPGVTERELALELKWFMEKHGADGTSFETIVASGDRGALPHGVASNKKIRAGELITFDFGALLDGYVSDITRTVAVGQVDQALLTIYDTVLRAQERALAGIRAGVRAREIDQLARSLIEEAGYGERFGHSTGHGLGLEVHEWPVLSGRSEAVLEDGMVVTVEPGIYVPGLGGVRIEDDVLVTQDGYELLTAAPKTLLVVG